MAKVLVLFAHPGQRHSRVNIQMAKVAAGIDGVTFVDLYGEYPKFDNRLARSGSASSGIKANMGITAMS